MKTNIKATNITLTDSITTYLNGKIIPLERLLVNEGDPAKILAEIEVGKTTRHHKHGEIFRAEINLHFGPHYLRVEAVADNLYAAIDQMKDELSREIKHFRKKEGTIFRRGARKIKEVMRGFYK